jgi:hypothetical protein
VTAPDAPTREAGSAPPGPGECRPAARPDAILNAAPAGPERAALSEEDRRAVDRLTYFMLKEVCCSATAALARMDPAAARSLLLGIETLLTSAVARIDAQQSEGTNSAAIAVAVGTRIAEVLDQARAGVDADRPRPTVRTT